MTPQAAYQNRRQARQTSSDQLRNRDQQTVNLRTAIFLAGVLVAWVVLGGWGVPWQFLLIPLVLFLATVIYHETVRSKLRAGKLAIEYYQRCLRRLDGQWSGVGATGEEFLDPQHPCSGDLDLFGHGSLFQLLNSPVTPVGVKTLASWLAPGANESLPARATVTDRQNAIRALRGQLDLRERLAIIGPTKQSQQDALHLQQWLARPGGLTAPGIRIVGLLLGLLGIAALGYFFTAYKLSPLLLVLVLQLGFLYRIREPLLAIKKHSEQAVFELRRIVQVLSALETVAGEEESIARLRNELHENQTRVSDIIHQLQRHVSQFENSRRNVVIAPLALISMRGLHYARSIDLWRTRYGSHIPRWFNTIGELEALLAFSQLHFENPGYCFPSLTKQPPQF
ncbi:MAG: hypothetical protein ACR2NM_08885, partial [Bythopirellula sp.]